MKEYLLNCGSFNIIVIPNRKSYYLLDHGAIAASITNGFLAGAPVDYSMLEPKWFQYNVNERWQGLDGREHSFDDSFSEADLIDRFVLKRFNSGSLVAVREMPIGQVKVFKPDKLQ